jgi:hypothetical protein
MIVEDASNSLEGLFKLLWSNSTVTFQIEVLKNALSGLSFVIGAVCLLTDFLENDCLQLCKSRCWNDGDIRVKTPSFDNCLDKVGLTF